MAITDLTEKVEAFFEFTDDTLDTNSECFDSTETVEPKRVVIFLVTLAIRSA